MLGTGLASTNVEERASIPDLRIHQARDAIDLARQVQKDSYCECEEFLVPYPQANVPWKVP